MSNTVTTNIEAIPIYREGSTDEESALHFQNHPAQFHVQAFRTLGPIYRTWHRNRMWVVLAGVEANDFVWKNGKLWSHSKSGAGFLEEMGPDHVSALDGEHHRQKRDILRPAFDLPPSMRFLPEVNQIFRQELERAALGIEIELFKFWADVVAKANTKTVAQADVPPDVVERMSTWQHLMLRGILLDEKRKEYYGRQEYLELKAETMEWLGRILDDHLRNLEKFDDNFSNTIRRRMEIEGPQPNRDNMINDLYLIMLAGIINTSNLINWATFYTLQRTEWLEQLRTELDPWDGENLMALAQMPKMKATVLETLRIRPGGHVLARTADADFEFGGYHLPAGTEVLHAHVLCHFLPEFYDDPYAFKPERFVESGKFVAKTNGVFGGGPHVCIGRNHSLLQGPIGIAQLLKYFDVQLLTEPPFELKVTATGTRTADTVLARLRRRTN